MRRSRVLSGRSVHARSVRRTREELAVFGGAIGAYVTTPTDVITTRIISDASGATEGQSVLDLGRSIVEDGGPFALLDGAAQRVLYWAPAIGIFLSCYCSIRQYVAFHFTF